MDTNIESKDPAQGTEPLESELKGMLKDEDPAPSEKDDKIFLKKRIFDAENEPHKPDKYFQDEELKDLLAKLEDAETYEANTQKQINAMMAGIDICMHGLNDGLDEAGYNGLVRQKEDLKDLDVTENMLKATLGAGKSANLSGFFFVHSDSRKAPEPLEDYALNDEVLEDLKTELINMRHKVNELSITLRSAKANCVKFRSKVAIRKMMLE